MDESIQKRLIFILGISTLIFFITTVGSCSNTHRQRVARDKEMAARLSLEEKMNKFMQTKTAIEEKLDKLSKELEGEKLAHQTTRKALAQEELVNQSLREELQKVTKFQEGQQAPLEEEATSKSEKSKKMR